jgi:hypothetical protein
MNPRRLALLSTPLLVIAAPARAGSAPYNPPPAAAAPAAPATTTWLVCSTRNRDNTAGWVTKPVAVSSSSIQDAEAAWRKKASADYAGFASSTGCTRLPSAAAADTKRAAILDQMRDEGMKPTDVAWSYTAAAPAAPSTSATPVTPEAAARAEMKSSQGWCEVNMHELRTLFGCDCFAQAVYEHRLAHPEEISRGQSDRQGSPPPVPALLTGAPWTLDVGKCLTDQRIDAYATEVLTVRVLGQPNTGKLSVKPEVYSCTKQRFTAAMRAKPLANLVQSTWNQSLSVCTGSRP